DTPAVDVKQSGLVTNSTLPTLPVHHLHTLIMAQSRGPFFKPVQLGAEPSDLGVKFVDPGVVTGLLFLPARLPCKHLRERFQGRLAPTLQLRGATPVLCGQLRHAAGFPEQFQNNPGLESW